MTEPNEIRTVLTEDKFSQVCKIGFIKQPSNYGVDNIYFYKKDILALSKGEIVTKIASGQVLKFMLTTLDLETVREIIKRSPVFYELSNEI
jgi:hypothetical protein